MTAIDRSESKDVEGDRHEEIDRSAQEDVTSKSAQQKDSVMEDENSHTQAKSVKGVFSQDNKDDFLSRLQRGEGTTSSSSSSALLPTSVTSSAAPTIATAASSSSSPAFEGRVTRSQTAAERGGDRQRGLVGLYNLGNTCFMNSALQCMSNTKELKDYFVSGAYKSEINDSNPLGMGGAMAKVFGELLTKLWSGGSGAWHPREFKTVLSRFSPQFIGYAQQDTQELLAFLLDGLHEDLNRIHKKPYIEAPDWQGGGLKEMITFAHKQWEIYKMRNDSVIVDLFQGQYRSTLVCPDCAKVSIKFDPFMYLTLPIPNRKSFFRKVHFLGLNGRTSIEAEMRLTAETSIDKLKRTLAAWFNVEDPKCLVACDVFSKSFYRIYTDFEAANEIQTNDVTYVYELPRPLEPIAPAEKPKYSSSYDSVAHLAHLEHSTPPPDKAEEYASLPLYSTHSVGNAPNGYSGYHPRPSHPSFGHPLFISLPKEKINDPEAIQEAVMQAYLGVATEREALQAYLTHAASERANASPVEGALEEWEMLSDGKNVVPDVDVRGKEEEDTVTEIRDDGETVTIVPNVRSEAVPATEEAGKFASGSADKVHVKKDETEAAFTIHFFVHREEHAPTTLKPDKYETHGEEIYQRAKRLGKSSPNESMKSSIRIERDNLQSTEVESNDEHNCWPLVYSGGALICQWSFEAYERFFGAASNDEGWCRNEEKFVDPELEADRQPDTKKLKRTLTIEDCLSEFTKEEQLGESDPWYCPNCKEFKQATKKFDLWKVPDILVVHLKRFSSGRITRDKIDSLIDFPIDGLDLTERVEGAKAVQQLNEDEEGSNDKLMESIGSLDANDDAVESDAPIYDLYAVDNHFGGLGGGHYTAYGKNPEDEKWYYFDDSSVRPVRDVNEVKSTAAYLLFYRRRTTRPIGGKSREKVRQRVKERQEREGEDGTGNGEGDDEGRTGGAGQGEDDAMDTDMASSSGVQVHGQARLGWDGVAEENKFSSGRPTLSTWDYEYENETNRSTFNTIPGALPAYESFDDDDDYDEDDLVHKHRSTMTWNTSFGAARQKNSPMIDSDSTSLDDVRSSEGAVATSTPDPGSMNVSEDEERIDLSSDERSQSENGGNVGRRAHPPRTGPRTLAAGGTLSEGLPTTTSNGQSIAILQ